MNLRRRERGALSNPILIGALTVLVAVVAVTLAYNANNGLPFVPKYDLHLKVRDASEVTHGAEVHMGGALIGIVDKIQPTPGPGGEPIALMDLKLNKEVQPLPVDSTFDVRLKGAIGLKYIAVTRGTSSQTWPNGATVPLSQSGSEVDLDQFLSMFDPATRVGVAESTIGFSDALAGRGNDINDAIGAFKPLVTHLGPVARNLASPQDRFRRLLARPGVVLAGAGAGRQGPGRPVQQPRHHVHRAVDRCGAVPAGLDLDDAAGV